MSRYQLVATKVAPAGMAQGRVTDFSGAMPRAELNDPGRPWSGDLYTTGAPTDPAEAFAQFAGENETVAWLDKQDDGTLIGWVQQGRETWRYSDPRLWATDVDAAQMERTDAPGIVPDPFTSGAAPDDSQMPANQTSTNFGPDVPDEVNPFLNDEGPDLEKIVGDLSEADYEAQEAMIGESPLDPEAPTDAGETGVVPDMETGEPVDQEPAGDEPVAEEAPEVDPDSEQAAEPEAEPGEEGEVEPEGEASEEDDEDDEKPWGKTEKKHTPGGEQHNQQSHGDWSDRIPSVPGSADPKVGSPAGDGGAAPAKRERPKVKIDKASIERMSATELEAVWMGQDIYDQDTLMAVSTRYDQLDPLEFGDFGGDHDAEQAAFRGAVPEEYVSWVAGGGKRPTSKAPNKKTRDADAYFDHIYAQYLRANDAANGYLWSRRGMAKARKMGWEEMALFDGTVRRDQLKLYASEELLRFFENDPRVSLAEFVAEKTNSAYISEFG